MIHIKDYKSGYLWLYWINFGYSVFRESPFIEVQYSFMELQYKIDGAPFKASGDTRFKIYF